MTSPHIEISIDRQELSLHSGGRLLRTWPVSTAEKGAGFTEGSHRTPTGRFQIHGRIGDGLDPDTVFRGREPVGLWDGRADDRDLILARILRLDGLDPENANTFERYIYIHGTNHESQLGEPASCGCVRMSREAVVELFQQVPDWTPVVIHPPSHHRGKLVFFDCDSTLSTIEGIDELARVGGPRVFSEVEALTRAAMDGEIPLDRVFPKRMASIAPDRESCEAVAARYIETRTPGVTDLIGSLKRSGWTPVILSGGFEPLIRPLAEKLGIRHVEAVPLHLDRDGRYLGYGTDYPTTRNGGKTEIIREWQRAMLPQRTVMIGDGISDLEAREACDLFVGYGGVVRRDPVRRGADLWITDFRDLAPSALEASA